MFRFVERQKAHYKVATMSRVLGVSTSGYYAWRSRPASPRALADEVLTEVIRGIHERSRGTYGAPRVLAELKDDHRISCGQKRVHRLMARAGIHGVHRRKRVKTTRQGKTAAPAPDLLDRDFTATAPDVKWVADITYIPTWAGFVYLAVVFPTALGTPPPLPPAAMGDDPQVPDPATCSERVFRVDHHG